MNEVVMGAVKAAGYETFEDYVCARSKMPLIEMAAELGVSSVTFIAYHNRWVKSHMDEKK